MADEIKSRIFSDGSASRAAGSHSSFLDNEPIEDSSLSEAVAFSARATKFSTLAEATTVHWSAVELVSYFLRRASISAAQSLHFVFERGGSAGNGQALPR